jgi:hypothetical protein
LNVELQYNRLVDNGAMSGMRADSAQPERLAHAGASGMWKGGRRQWRQT